MPVYRMDLDLLGVVLMMDEEKDGYLGPMSNRHQQNW